MYTLFFKVKIINVAARPKMLACTPSDVGASVRPFIKDVNNIYSNQSGISGFPKTWIKPVELFRATFPSCLFMSRLQKCPAVRLQKIFYF